MLKKNLLCVDCLLPEKMHLTLITFDNRKGVSPLIMRRKEELTNINYYNVDMFRVSFNLRFRYHSNFNISKQKVHNFVDNFF